MGHISARRPQKFVNHPEESGNSPLFKYVISTLIELQGNEPASVVSVLKCPLHVGDERAELWCKKKRVKISTG